jgi:ATP-binding cassette subfamily B protein RaxB
MGTAISGGQKQRLLLARALYKQPKLLFLDEATSHLDVQRESIVNAGVRDLKLTRVIVAHRPQTIASADRVIVLEGGSIRQDLRVAAADGTPAASAPVPAASFRTSSVHPVPVMAESSGPAM